MTAPAQELATSLADPQVRDDARAIAARYPQARSALLPMLHLVQSVEGFVSPAGIALCSEELGLTKAEVGAVATFYTMYRRRPAGTYHVGVCTNTLCAVMGGDEIFDRVKDHLGIGNNETTADGAISIEHLECNAACDYAPVMMVNWEFYDNQTPSSAVALLDSLKKGDPVPPTRGPSSLCTFKQAARVLAGFPDGRAAEGVTAGPASLAGLDLAKELGQEAPAYPQKEKKERTVDSSAVASAPAAGGSQQAPASSAGSATGGQPTAVPSGQPSAAAPPSEPSGTPAAGAKPTDGADRPAPGAPEARTSAENPVGAESNQTKPLESAPPTGVVPEMADAEARPESASPAGTDSADAGERAAAREENPALQSKPRATTVPDDVDVAAQAGAEGVTQPTPTENDAEKA